MAGLVEDFKEFRHLLWVVMRDRRVSAVAVLMRELPR